MEVRYTPDNIAELRRILYGCPYLMKVEVKEGIPLNTKSVADLRKLPDSHGPHCDHRRHFKRVFQSNVLLSEGEGVAHQQHNTDEVPQRGHTENRMRR